ncbi:MAG: response regulator transcription factor [Actinomycetota bacterium]|nr:response regulator transcription factor [Actinomycetota bacterium]
MTEQPLPRLLIADDDPVVVSMLRAQLAPSFDVVAAARDAEDAIALANRHQPDVAIIDVQMPTGGGLRATKEMQSRASGTAIVVLSADESDGMVRDMIGAGAIAYVRKGATTEELAMTLQRAIVAHARLGQPVQ